MENPKKYWRLVLTLLAIFLAACGKTSKPATATVPPGQIETQAIQTLIAGWTPTPEAFTPAPVPPTKTPRHTNTPLPSVTAGPTGKPTSSIFSGTQTNFRDDFESLTGWFTGNTDKFTVEFEEGGYRMYVNLVTGAWPVYSVREMEFDDISVSVDVMREDGPDGSYFGTVCRFGDLRNYYRFVLYTGGYYEIAKMVDGKITVLDTDKEVNLILPEKTNTIRGDCVGSILTMYVNGKMAAEVLDSELTSGYTGLVAGTNEKEGLDVLFDNFILSEP